MELRKLGKSQLQVSTYCLGTMTWGEQNTEQEAHAQLDFAIERGVNFIDTAELYPVPPRAETYGRTEEILGRWDKLKKLRDRLVIATKVVGPGESVLHVRDGKPRLNRRHITEACEASLKRLRVDYIDLYQLHWPDRTTNTFGKRNFKVTDLEEFTPIEETLSVLQDLVKAGKVRVTGVSNETPWGLMEYLQIAKEKSWQRIASIQNPYNLLNRSFEIGLAEIAHREQVGLLAYSPLAFGMLTGKYQSAEKPAEARLTRFQRFSRYSSSNAQEATERYVQLARDHGLDPAQMALAFARTRPFMASVIVGATKLEQLQKNLDSVEVVLSDEVLQGIEAIHADIPNPCP